MEPSEALGSKHNGGRKVSAGTPWERYLQWRAKPRGTTPFDGSFTTAGEWQALEASLPPAQRNLSLALEATSVDDVLAQWEQVAAAADTGRRFHWKISLGCWQWSHALRAHVEQKRGAALFKSAVQYELDAGGNTSFIGCDYGDVRVSRHATRVADRLVAELTDDESNSQFVTLHVRRGDTVSQCDTTVPAVLAFLNCSKALAAYAPRRPQLLIFTDETDEAYLSELLSELQALPRWGGKVSHGDALVAATIGQRASHDNYEVYAAAAYIMSRAGLALAIERCNGTVSCEPTPKREREGRPCHPCLISQLDT